MMSSRFTKMMSLNLFLVVIVIGGSIWCVSSSSSSVSNLTEPCNGICGQLTLPYPFGFSGGCKILFNCSLPGGKAKIGSFLVQNVTETSIFVGVPHNCSRTIEEMSPLFGDHYAPSWENSFLLEDCTRSTDGCSINQKFLETQLKLQSCDAKGNISCFSTDTNSSSTRSAKYFSMQKLRSSSCRLLFSSIAFESVGVDAGIALEFERVRLGWWLKGGCGNEPCGKNANCTPVDTPDGKGGHQCSCLEGYHGNGFINTCRKG